jgi:hypothetical protein
MSRSCTPRPTLRQAGLAVAAALALLAAPGALAAHPMVTDDTGTQGAGRGQIELAGEMGSAHLRDGDERLHERTGEVAATLSYGLSDTLDVVVSAPTSFSRIEGGGTIRSESTGAGDLALGLKWRLLEASGFSLAVKPGMTLPTGDAARGLGAGRVGLGAAVVATQEVGPVRLHLNAGLDHGEFARAEDRRARRADVFHVSLAASGEVLPGLQLVGNVGIETSGERADTSSPAFALAGLVYTIGGRIDLDVGIKADTGGHTAGLAGLAARF